MISFPMCRNRNSPVSMCRCGVVPGSDGPATGGFQFGHVYGAAYVEPWNNSLDVGITLRRISNCSLNCNKHHCIPTPTPSPFPAQVMLELSLLRPLSFDCFHSCASSSPVNRQTQKMFAKRNCYAYIGKSCLTCTSKHQKVNR